MAGIPNSSDQFLAHYGVKGMKWGKRKSKGAAMSKTEFLNPKSVATPFPKNRPTPGVTDLSPKPIKQISDNELRARINRIQMETQYKQLIEPKTEDSKSKVKVIGENFEKGHKAVQKIIGVANTAQKIYKIYDSDMVRVMMDRPTKEAEREAAKKK